jgi:Amidase
VQVDPLDLHLGIASRGFTSRGSGLGICHRWLLDAVVQDLARQAWSSSTRRPQSSGGSAAAVAARIVPMAHGNDLGARCASPRRRAGCSG